MTAILVLAAILIAKVSHWEIYGPVSHFQIYVLYLVICFHWEMILLKASKVLPGVLFSKKDSL